MAKTAPKKAGKQASTQAKGRGTPRPKPRVMQAALLLWTHRIYHSADAAIRYRGGYASHFENPDRFRLYADIVKELRALAEKYDRLAGRQVAKLQGLRGGCEDDQDCPDDQICVHGTCEPLFPQD
jgi:hypothetical protein